MALRFLSESLEKSKSFPVFFSKCLVQKISLGSLQWKYWPSFCFKGTTAVRQKRLLSANAGKMDGAFISTGFSDWKEATLRLIFGSTNSVNAIMLLLNLQSHFQPKLKILVSHFPRSIVKRKLRNKHFFWSSSGTFISLLGKTLPFEDLEEMIDNSSFI